MKSARLPVMENFGEGDLSFKRKTLYLPLPQDCQVIRKEDGKLEAHLLELEKGKGYESDGAQYRLVGVSNKKSESAEGKWVTVKDWEKLVLKREPVEVLPLGELCSGTAQDGHLFEQSHSYSPRWHAVSVFQKRAGT